MGGFGGRNGKGEMYLYYNFKKFFFKKKKSSTFNNRKTDLCRFSVSLVYRVSSKIGRATLTNQFLLITHIENKIVLISFLSFFPFLLPSPQLLLLSLLLRPKPVFSSGLNAPFLAFQVRRSPLRPHPRGAVLIGLDRIL